MTTKTKTITAAEASRQRLAEAREKVAEHRANLEVTCDEIDAVKRSWTAGDDTIPASRLNELQADETRLSSLLAAAERQVKLAERTLLTDKPELAEAIAYALGSSVLGIEAEAVSETPKESDGDAQTPRLFVVQTKPHQDHGDGTVSGECVIRLVGPAWVKSMDANAIRRTLHSAGVRFKQDLHLDGNQIRVEAQFARPKVPTILRMPEDKGVPVSFDVSHIIERETWNESSGQSLATVWDSTGQIVSVSVDSDGIRTAVIDHALTISNNPRGYWSADTAIEQTKTILAGLRDHSLPMLGRVVAVEHVSTGMAENVITTGRGRQIITRFTTVSKVRPA